MRLWPVALLVAALAGCGKGDLQRAQRPSHAPTLMSHRAAARRSGPATAAGADAFAAAVNLTAADVPGAIVAHEDASEGRQKSHCSSDGARAVGGGRSPRYERGHGATKETIASAVVVLADPAQARADLAHASSAAGMACYEREAKATLEAVHRGGLRLGQVELSRLQGLPVAGADARYGLRLQATAVSTRGGPAIHVYIDALAFAYGPAEVELYDTSLVQPEPARTEQELLALMMARARML